MTTATILATRCAGGGHIIISVTDSLSNAWTIVLDADDVIGGRKGKILRELSTRDAYLLQDIRQAIKVAGAVTFAQAKAAAEAAAYTLAEDN